MSLVSSSQHTNNHIVTTTTTTTKDHHSSTPNATLDLQVLQAFANHPTTAASTDASIPGFSHLTVQTPYPPAFAQEHPEAHGATATLHDDKPYYAHPDHSIDTRAMSQPPHSALERHSPHLKSDQDLPLDPNIVGSAQSPGYNNPNGQALNGGPYSPYAQQEMQHPGYGASNTLYQQPRPDWGSYAQTPTHHSMQQYPGATEVHTPTTVTSAGPRSAGAVNSTGQVYSFVPIPGSSQHKRPRRRFEEIERMYKCGYNGCEKAYGTLNHLNAHVTMQSHGLKRTPEEFKEIRKEWKQRKKEEESSRKNEQDQQRRNNGSMSSDSQVPAAAYQQGRTTLPPIAGQHAGPIGYQPGGAQGQYQPQPPPAAPIQQIQEYGNQPHVQYNGYPPSPYTTANMYGNPAATHGIPTKYESNGHSH